MLLNTLLVPSLAERSIKEATYDEFLDTLDSGTVEEVNLEDDVIYYSVKKGNETQVYKTGRIKDSQEVERLKDAGVKFSEEITTENFSDFKLIIVLYRADSDFCVYRKLA